MSFTYTCMECGKVMRRKLEVKQCARCTMDLCVRCSIRHTRVCAWCYEEVPKHLAWANKFSIVAILLVPIVVLLAPVPVPLLVMALQSTTIGWFAVMYIAIGLIVLGSFKAAIVKKMMASIPLHTSSSIRTQTQTTSSSVPALNAGQVQVPAAQSSLPPARSDGSAQTDYEAERNPLLFTLPDPTNIGDAQGVEPLDSQPPMQMTSTVIDAMHSTPADATIQEGTIDVATPLLADMDDAPLVDEAKVVGSDEFPASIEMSEDAKTAGDLHEALQSNPQGETDAPREASTSEEIPLDEPPMSVSDIEQSILDTISEPKNARSRIDVEPSMDDGADTGYPPEQPLEAVDVTSTPIVTKMPVLDDVVSNPPNESAILEPLLEPVMQTELGLPVEPKEEDMTSEIFSNETRPELGLEITNDDLMKASNAAQKRAQVVDEIEHQNDSYPTQDGASEIPMPEGPVVTCPNCQHTFQHPGGKVLCPVCFHPLETD